ncbi:MAG: hypothetical protein AAGC65_13020 [Mucilaginibacter sp.]
MNTQADEITSISRYLKQQTPHLQRQFGQYGCGVANINGQIN